MATISDYFFYAPAPEAAIIHRIVWRHDVPSLWAVFEVLAITPHQQVELKYQNLPWFQTTTKCKGINTACVNKIKWKYFQFQYVNQGLPMGESPLFTIYLVYKLIFKNIKDRFCLVIFWDIASSGTQAQFKINGMLVYFSLLLSWHCSSAIKIKKLHLLKTLVLCLKSHTNIYVIFQCTLNISRLYNWENEG